MRKQIVFFFLSFLFFSCPAQVLEDEFALSNQLIVQFSAAQPDLVNQLPSGVFLKEWLSRKMNIVLLEKEKEGFTVQDKKDIAKLPNAKTIQHNHKVSRRNFTPDDLSSLQWNLYNSGGTGSLLGADIKALAAWGIKHDVVSPYGDSIVLAIVEDPMDLFHSDINYFINYNEIDSNGIDDDGNGYIDDYRGWDPIHNKPAANDLSYDHGIHVAGIAAARTNNSNGIAGVGYGVKVLPIFGSTDVESDVVKAYDYTIAMRKLYDATNGAKGAFVVASNSSFGIGSYGANPVNSPIWCAMYDSMGKAGILSAVAGPNANVDIDAVHDVPSECPSRFLVSVTNTNRLDNRNSQAAYGPIGIDLGAPGTTIYSTKQSNTYGFMSGTSMSTPHVCGAIGAMYTVACPRLFENYRAFPDSFALLFKQYLLSGTDRINSMHHVVASSGRLNLYKAFLNVQSYNCDTCTFSYHVSRSQISCAGSASGMIHLSSTSNLSYLWSDGNTSANRDFLSAGIYTVSVKDGLNCSVQQSFFFDEPQAIKINGINIVPITSTNPGNITIVANAGNDYLSYAMDTGSYQQTYVFATTVPGNHTIHIKNEFGCVVDTVITIGIDNGLNSLSILKAIAFPNPVAKTLTVQLFENKQEEYRLMLVDIQGRILIDFRSLDKQQTLDVSGLAEGIYLLKIESGNQQQYPIRIAVSK